MLRNNSLRKLFHFHAESLRSSSTQVNIKKLEAEQEATKVVEDEELVRRERGIEEKRNKSRLKPQDYRMLHEENPYPEPNRWHHGTLKYMRRTYGRYGAASGVDPSICWPVKEELEDAKEYERVKYPLSISQMVQNAKLAREEKERNALQRQQDIVKKVEKLEQWKRELHEKIEKKESEALQAKLRKDRLIEEVRKHFGYMVDPKDDRFKELLEKKEKEQKKEMKEARKREKEAKLIKRMLNKKDAATTSEEHPETKEENKNN